MDGKGVSLMNIPARAAGIAPGSTLATARSIVADLKHFNRDVAEERRRLRLLAEAAYRYTPASACRRRTAWCSKRARA